MEKILFKYTENTDKPDHVNEFEDNNPKQPEETVIEEFPIPSGILDTDKFEGGQEELDAIYGWYADAMLRRDRQPLEQNRFQRHFFEEGARNKTYMYGDMEKGFVFGFCKYGIFIPTHFAPKTMRGGYEIFKTLAENKEIPVVGAVTEDLADTLKKMKGWKTWKISLLAYFNNDLIDKVVVYNSYPKIRRKMLSLVREFIKETEELKRKTIEEDEYVEGEYSESDDAVIPPEITGIDDPSYSNP